MKIKIKNRTLRKIGLVASIGILIIGVYFVVIDYRVSPLAILILGINSFLESINGLKGK